MAGVNLKIGLLSGGSPFPCAYTHSHRHIHTYIHVTHARFVKDEENKQNNKNPQKFSA